MELLKFSNRDRYLYIEKIVNRTFFDPKDVN